jgi:tripartite-type tricarboxylate transporter receptor subunit TctC
MRKIASAIGIAAAVAGAVSSTPAIASFPSKPITLIVPWSPGGSVDMTARKLAEALNAKGISLVVENIPGASGMIGLRKVATAAPDGYTLGIATTSLMGAIAQKTTPLTTADFTPLVQTTAEQELLLVPASSTVKTPDDFIKKMKSENGRVSFGTPGAFTVNHVYGELLSRTVGTKMIHAPYGGGAKVLVDLAGGQIDAGILKPSEAKALIDAGQVRPVGAFAVIRSELYPNVPTFQEAGVDLFTFGDLPLMSYIAGPKGLPEDVAKKLTQAFEEAVKSKTYASFAKEYGMTGTAMKGKELADKIQQIQHTYDAILPNIAEK